MTSHPPAPLSTPAPRIIHVHFVSDSTGETVYSVGRACLVQFGGLEVVEHAWSLVRTRTHLEKVVAGIAAHPGPVLVTVVEESLREALQENCRRLAVPMIPVLDPVIGALGGYLGMRWGHEPGKQHMLDSEYFNRIDAMSFALAHDDGMGLATLDEAQIILVGVSRTSKTPTCLYLANRGFKLANIPLVPELGVPHELLAVKRALVVGLLYDPERLAQIRRNRLLLLGQDETGASYVDLDAIRQELLFARRLYNRQQWPTVDVTRRSIEETAAAILDLYQRR